eukprot:maker-scaffold778_size98284-snap-gene-0.17 protein:Tk07185 transcript:maker-scaffold778_size98284-snap-gene-0.17-mRNA-1 annotation:"threonine dehydratase"
MSGQRRSQFHIETPLLKSKALSQLVGGRDVYLKLDNLQPPGSFKIRGIGRTCQEAVKNGAKKLVGSSGGNAGVAMAFAADEMGTPLTLFIPKSTPKIILDNLKVYKAEVRVVGNNWDEANAEAMKMVSSHSDAFFVHPFEQETTWEGHSTLVDEIKNQLEREHEDKRIPASIVTCVGGGGLAVGIIMGLQKHGWNHVPVVCMETSGSNCLQQSIQAGRKVKLESIDTIAKSLGALAVCDKLLELCTTHPVVPRVVTDRDALSACQRFAKDHRMLVEPACGAVLSAIYSKVDLSLPDEKNRPLVLVVCGGNMASFELYQTWQNQLLEH